MFRIRSRERKRVLPIGCADVLDKAVLAEELGFDGFAVGERHEDPFISSSPPVVLSNIAARTSKIGLFTGVTTLSSARPGPRIRGLFDARQPVRWAARADHRQGQRRGAGRIVPCDHRRSMGPQSRRLRVVPTALGEARDVTGPAGSGRRWSTPKALPAPAAEPNPYLARQRNEYGFGRPRRPSR